MNPNRGGEQPAPQLETFSPGGQEVVSPAAEHSVEIPKTPESSPSTQSAPPISVPAVPVVADDTQALMSAPTSVIAGDPALNIPTSDSGRIEKQWVEKAKNIIAQTKDDPFTQKNEMSRVKAAYIEKRFNKKLKVDDAKV